MEVVDKNLNRVNVNPKVGKIEEEPAVKKLSYEQLENAAHQLSEQSRQLYVKNQQLEKAVQALSLEGLYKRLDYLWLVINSDSAYISGRFKDKCATELQFLMTQPVEEDTEESTEETKE